MIERKAWARIKDAVQRIAATEFVGANEFAPTGTASLRDAENVSGRPTKQA